MSAASLYVSSTGRRLRLRRRRDLQAHPLQFGGRRYWGVKDPVSLRYYQLREEEHRILLMLDGRASLDDIRDRFERDFAPRRLSLHQLQSFLGMLHHEGLIVADQPGQDEELLLRHEKGRRQAFVRSLSNPLAIRVRGIDPTRLLDWLEPAARRLLSPWCVVPCLLLVLAAVVLVAAHFDRVESKLPDFEAFFAARNVVLLAGTLAVVKVLHELGHGLACRHFGGECHEIGVMFLVFTPCLYCNVSDAWMLQSKWQRVAISAAGMYVELVLAAVCTFLWWFSQPGLLNALCLNVMFVCSVSTLLFNGNPLLRYDGYYILSDLVEVPNLGQQSSAVVRHALGRWFLDADLENERVLPERHRGWLALYAVASFAYRWFVVLAILWFVYHALEPYRLEVLAQLLAVATIAGMVAAPVGRGVTYVRDPLRRQDVNWSRFLFRGALAVAVLVGVCLIPLPFRVTAPAMIEAEDARRVYVSVAGRLPAEGVVEPGQPVEAGDTLVRLQNLELKLEMERLQGQVRQQRLAVENLRTRSITDKETAAQLQTADEALRDLERRLAKRAREQQELHLTAPVAGTVLPPFAEVRQTEEGDLPPWSGTPLDEQNRRAWLETGTLLCLIGDPARLEAVLVVDQSDVEFVAAGQRVRLQLDETPGEILWGTISEIAELDLQVIPRQLLLHEDLPTRRDQAGTPRPVSTSYQARVRLDDHRRPLLLGATGRAKIHARPQSLAARAWRYLRRTFRFDL